MLHLCKSILVVLNIVSITSKNISIKVFISNILLCSMKYFIFTLLLINVREFKRTIKCSFNLVCYTIEIKYKLVKQVKKRKKKFIFHVNFLKVTKYHVSILSFVANLF